jgi:biotin carboxylase
VNLLLVSMQAWAGGLRTVQCARVLGPVHVGTSDDRLPFSLASSCAGVLKLPPWNEADPAEGVERLGAYVRQHRIGAVVPSRVEDAKLLHHARPRLGGCLVFPISPPAVLDRLNNKWSFAQLCREAGVPIPPTGLLERAGDANLATPGGLDYPVVVKPLELYGNRGFHCFDSAGALGRHLASGAPHSGLPLLMQEYVPGQDLVLGLLAQGGRVLLSLAHHRTPSGHAVFQPDGEAHELGRRIVAATDYTGLACIDLRRDARTGRLLAIECNPRCWDSLYLAYWAGWNFIAAGLDCAAGHRVEAPDVPLPATAYAPVGFRRDVFRGDWSWLRLSRRNLEGVLWTFSQMPGLIAMRGLNIAKRR